MYIGSLKKWIKEEAYTFLKKLSLLWNIQNIEHIRTVKFMVYSTQMEIKLQFSEREDQEWFITVDQSDIEGLPKEQKLANPSSTIYLHFLFYCSFLISMRCTFIIEFIF